MTAPLYNIGPDAIAEAGVVGGPGFVLSRVEWIALQTACTNAAALPTTQEAFRKSLGDAAPADLLDFSRLLEAYQAIGAHAAQWIQNTYPAVVALAGGVCQYGMSTVSSYYPQLLAEATVLSTDPQDQHARAALKAILDHLGGETEERANRVGDVVEQLSAFVADTEADRVAMVGADGDGGLVRHYQSRYGEASPEVSWLSLCLAESDRLLRSMNATYDRDVVVATTTPTYAWRWPFGTVSSAVVAGVYGHRAIEALERARVTEAELAALPAGLAAAARLMITLHGAEAGTAATNHTATECLPVIQRMQGVWSGISADLGALASMVDDETGKVVEFMMKLGIEQAVSDWAEAADAASVFRLNAYLKEDPKSTMAAWKVRTQFASSTALAA